MISTDTTTGHPFTPAWLCQADGATPKPGAPVFRLRAGGLIERGQMEAELSGQHRAGKVWAFELNQAVESGFRHLMAEDPALDQLLGLLAEEGELKEGESLAPEDAKLLDGARAILAEFWPEYRDLIAQLARRREIAPIVALRRFCIGWEKVAGEGGVPVPFAIGPDGFVAESSLARLQPMELRAAGNQAYALCYPVDAEGNSGRLGSSAKDPTTSGSDAAVPMGRDGSSPADAG